MYAKGTPLNKLLAKFLKPKPKDDPKYTIPYEEARKHVKRA